jgi:hypothetical protein
MMIDVGSASTDFKSQGSLLVLDVLVSTLGSCTCLHVLPSRNTLLVIVFIFSRVSHSHRHGHDVEDPCRRSIQPIDL